jgi:HrpA-like RNA helicase
VQAADADAAPAPATVHLLRGVPHLHCPGRAFPVSVTYTPTLERAYVPLAVDTVRRIHTEEPRGHVLVFTAGHAEAAQTAAAIEADLLALHAKGVAMEDFVVLVAHGGQPSKELKKIFLPTAEGTRKIVVATSLAETSLTIDGVCYVVDTGYTREKVFRHRSCVQATATVPTSRSSADQRAGRAGR